MTQSQEVDVHNQDSRRRDVKNKSVKRITIAIAKVLILAIVCLWLIKTLYASWDAIKHYDWRPQWGWIVASGAFYLIGFFFAAIYWLATLRRLGQRAGLWQTVAAYYYGQLGKYAPGKALVVIIRTSVLASRRGNRASVVATSVFYETLAMMGVGAFIGASILLVTLRDNKLFSMLAFAVALGALAPLLPPIFTRIVKFLKIGKDDCDVQNALQRFSMRHLALGIALMTALWLFFGLSLWAALRGLGVATEPACASLHHYVAVVSLATSLGFVMLVSPGGLGVREFILATALVPYLKTLLTLPENASVLIDATAIATVVSLEHRMISIIAELCAATALFIVEKLTNARKRRDRHEEETD